MLHQRHLTLRAAKSLFSILLSANARCPAEKKKKKIRKKKSWNPEGGRRCRNGALPQSRVAGESGTFAVIVHGRDQPKVLRSFQRGVEADDSAEQVCRQAQSVQRCAEDANRSSDCELSGSTLLLHAPLVSAAANSTFPRSTMFECGTSNISHL